MKIGIYNKYWNTFGGGEKHSGAIAQFLSRVGNVDLVGPKEFSIADIESRLNLELGDCRAVVLPNGFNSSVEEASSNYDLWINACYLSTARSRAKKSILLVYFPSEGSFLLNVMRLYTPFIPPEWLRNLLAETEFLKTYDLILANSSYTQHWIDLLWGRKSCVLYPPVDLFTGTNASKKKIILSVGRFFVGGHNKKQDVMMKCFIDMYESGECEGWEFHLCGGTHSLFIHRHYLNRLAQMAKNYPIFIHQNIPRKALEKLYQEASLFWHATGYGLDERKSPEKFEHFGITTVEAMSAGCIPIVINRAGQREIITNGENGFLWDSLEELKDRTKDMMAAADTTTLRSNAVDASNKFSASAFQARLNKIISENLKIL